MELLSYQDLELIITALGILHADILLDSLPERMLKAAETIIQSEIVAFDAFNSNDKYDTTVWTSQEDLYTPESVDVFRQFAFQHPLIPIVIGNKIQSAVKMTDYISQSEFENLELYNEYFRLIKVKRQMGMALPIANDFTIACSVNRSEKDFTERERLLLNILSPHLLTTIRHTYFIQRLEQKELNWQAIINSMRTGVIVLDANGKTRFVSEAALQMLEGYFAGEPFDANDLPETIRLWTTQSDVFEGDDIWFPPPPLIKQTEDGDLQINLTYNSQTKERTLMLAEQIRLTPTALAALGLTKRETEVLFWMTQGKTNDEIGFLCHISPRTVKKHAEHIYSKLGVETRTAAVKTVFEVLKH